MCSAHIVPGKEVLFLCSTSFSNNLHANSSHIQGGSHCSSGLSKASRGAIGRAHIVFGVLCVKPLQIPFVLFMLAVFSERFPSEYFTVLRVRPVALLIFERHQEEQFRAHISFLLCLLWVVSSADVYFLVHVLSGLISCE